MSWIVKLPLLANQITPKKYKLKCTRNVPHFKFLIKYPQTAHSHKLLSLFLCTFFFHSTWKHAVLRINTSCAVSRFTVIFNCTMHTICISIFRYFMRSRTSTGNRANIHNHVRMCDARVTPPIHYVILKADATNFNIYCNHIAQLFILIIKHVTPMYFLYRWWAPFNKTRYYKRYNRYHFRCGEHWTFLALMNGYTFGVHTSI